MDARVAGTRSQRVVLAAAILLGGSCSSVAPETPGPECAQNGDCPEHWLCDLNQGGVCVPSEQARRPQLAFSIEESSTSFSAHLRACDEVVEVGSNKVELDFVDADEFRHPYALRAFATKFVPDCENECDGECDVDGNCVSEIAVDFSIVQASRIGLVTANAISLPYPPVVDEQPTADPARFVRARYPEDDDELGGPGVADDPLAAGLPLVLEIREAGRASFRRALDPRLPGDADIVVLRDRDCDVAFKGQVRRFDTLDGIEGALVEARFAEAVATPSTVLLAAGSEATACEADVDCGRGWACNAEGTCGLDLRGVLAGATTTLEASGGIFDTVDPLRIHGYCEDGVSSRELDLTVRPPETIGLPTVTYAIDQEIEFGVAGLEITQSLDGDLCVPAWQPAHEVTFTFGGDPVPAGGPAGEGFCCDVDCLSSPDPTITACRAFSQIRFETALELPTPTAAREEWLAAWAADGCMPLREVDGVVGYYRPPISETCTEASEACSVPLTEGESGGSRSYRISVWQPNGSFFRSETFEREVAADTGEIDELHFQLRTRLTGHVCDAEQLGSEEGLCAGGEHAAVMAERLRMPGDPEIFGPTFFERTADASGAFILPVDPGVYVVTALPAPDAPHGPAPFTIVDLRPEALAGAQESDNDFPIDLLLSSGVTVNVNLSEFDFNAKLLPIDWGSWAHQADALVDPEGNAVDLNDLATCYGGQSCSIRKLRISPVSPLLSKRAQFTMRADGPQACP